MAEDKKNHDTPDLDQRDLKNPRDRDALKRAADDFLKSRKAEEYAMAQDDEIEAQANNWAELDRLRAENGDLKDQLLRLAADMENLRKRTARDVHDARAYSVANFARDVLSVSDNLKRALEAIPADALAQGDAGFKSLAEGVEMTERSLMTAMERHGVKKIEPLGQKFDPNFHQAMFEIQMLTYHTTPCCRSHSQASSLATACCARPWSAYPRVAPSKGQAKASRNLARSIRRRKKTPDPACKSNLRAAFLNRECGSFHFGG